MKFRIWPPKPMVAVTVVVWTVAYTYFSLNSLLSDTKWPVGQYVLRIGLCVMAMGLCGLMSIPLKQVAERSAGVRVAVAIGLSSLCALTYAAMAQLGFRTLFPAMISSSSLYDILLSIVFNGVALFWVFFAWCILFFALSADGRARRRELELAQAQTLLSDAQNRMLRYQINPHFLFNTLNALSALIVHKENETAESMLQSLSAFLRDSLYGDFTDKMSVAREVEVQRRYLEIERIRFGERLTYHEDVPTDLTSALVPALILQPLIENAIKHGVGASSGQATISVTARRQGDRLMLTVEDDGPSAKRARAREGIGLANVRQRLDAMYGGSAVLTYGPITPRGFRAEVTVPLELPQAQPQAEPQAEARQPSPTVSPSLGAAA